MICIYFYLFIYKYLFYTETAAVCVRSEYFPGCLRFFISCVCYIVEISLSIYMCMFFFTLSLKYIGYWSPVCQELQPPKTNSPLWSLQIKNAAPFSFQPDLVCRIPRRGLWRVQEGDYDYQCAAVLLSTGWCWSWVGIEASHKQQNCRLLVWALLLEIW